MDVNNITQPVQSLVKFYDLQVDSLLGETSKWQIELGPNEFVGYDDKIGFIEEEPEPYEFFSIEDF